MCLMQFHCRCWANSTWFGKKGKETGVRWGLCHIAERQYRALIKPHRSQILSRIRCCFNYHELNAQREWQPARGDTSQVLEIGFAPQRQVSFVVQRAASGILGLVSNMCSMCLHHQVCILGGGDEGYSGKQEWCCFFLSFTSWQGCIV